MKTEMNRESTMSFIQKVQEQMAPKKFEKVKDELEFIEAKYHQSFLYLMYAGYSSRIILSSYKNLYRFTQRSYLDFSSALKLITFVSSSVVTGLEVKDLTLFELN